MKAKVREFINPTQRHQVGDIVYQAYTPQRAGKILSVGEAPCMNPQYKMRTYTVAIPTKKGVYRQVWNEMGVRGYAELIADHAKKLATHQAHYAKMQALVVPEETDDEES